MLSFSYFCSWDGANNYYLFWLGILTGILPLMVLLADDISACHTVLVLIVVGLIIYSMTIYRSPNFFVDRDEMVHYQAYSDILSDGNIQFIHTTFPISNLYPGFDIAVAIGAMITGMSPLLFGKVFVGIVHSLLLVIVWMICSVLSLSRRHSAAAIFIYSSCIGYVQFDTMVSYESLGIFLCFLAMFLLLRRCRRKSVPMGTSVVFGITLAALIVTHHLSTYMFILFSWILLVLTLVASFIQCDSKIETRRFSKIGSLVLASTVFALSWLIYVASQSINYLVGGLLVRLENIVQLSLFGGAGARQLMAGDVAPFMERFILHFVFPPVLVMLSVLGLWLLLRDRGMYPTEYFVFGLFGPVGFFAVLPLILTNTGSELVYRFWSFLFLGVSMCAATAYTVVSQKCRRAVGFLGSCMMCFLFIGGIMLAKPIAMRFPTTRHYVNTPSFYNLEEFAAANWLRDQAGKYNYLLGSKFDQDVFGSFGGQYVNRSASEKLFLLKRVNVEDVLSIRPRPQFIVVNFVITELKYSVPYGSYFFPHLSTNNAIGMFGYRLVFPKNRLLKFNGSNFFIENYDNGVVTIYRII